jgi:hypothetical protein
MGNFCILSIHTYHMNIIFGYFTAKLWRYISNRILGTIVSTKLVIVLAI